MIAQTIEMKITEVLHELQKNLNAPKNQFNRFGGYNYRSCEDILSAIKPLLPAGHILTLSDKIDHIGERFYVTATASLHSTESTISVSASAREQENKKGMDASQITGSASSYARKYALNGLLLIDDTKDADTQAPSTRQTTATSTKAVPITPAPGEKTKKITAEQETYLKKQLKVKNLPDSFLTEFYDITELKDLNAGLGKEALNRIDCFNELDDIEI